MFYNIAGSSLGRSPEAYGLRARLMVGQINYIAGSSNGRTSPSEGEYLGSNPGPAATLYE